METLEKTPKLILDHNIFRDYFFGKLDVFYESNNEERIAILDDF